MKKLIIMFIVILLAGCVPYPAYFDCYYPYPYGYYGYAEPNVTVFLGGYGFHDIHGFHGFHGFHGGGHWGGGRR